MLRHGVMREFVDCHDGVTSTGRDALSFADVSACRAHNPLPALIRRHGLEHVTQHHGAGRVSGTQGENVHAEGVKVKPS